MNPDLQFLHSLNNSYRNVCLNEARKTFAYNTRVVQQRQGSNKLGPKHLLKKEAYNYLVHKLVKEGFANDAHGASQMIEVMSGEWMQALLTS